MCYFLLKRNNFQFIKNKWMFKQCLTSHSINYHMKWVSFLWLSKLPCSFLSWNQLLPIFSFCIQCCGILLRVFALCGLFLFFLSFSVTSFEFYMFPIATMFLMWVNKYTFTNGIPLAILWTVAISTFPLLSFLL